jgi:hypothetical protein
LSSKKMEGPEFKPQYWKKKSIVYMYINHIFFVC